MDYKDALEAAGAIIHDYIEFGDYQGSWFAIVSYKGSGGLIRGSYGSCSGCDAFQAEFMDEYENLSDKELKEKLKEFGKGYLNNEIFTFEEAIKEFNNYVSWDTESQDVLDWLNKNKKIFHNIEFNDKIKKEFGVE